MTHEYDLVVRRGTIIDGAGGERFVADVAIKDGWIVTVGEVVDAGEREIDARGLIVTPGFVDIHTHYDGQAIWSDRFAPSSDHGVTTVVTGNCGVGFAPARRADHAALISLMEGVEDVPEAVMAKGLDWSWETFPEYLDAIERRPHDIDIAAFLPHSPLRVYAMGQRGLDREPATAEDLERIRRLTVEALNAGAMGVGTSRITFHRTSKGELIPSFDADETEYLAIAAALRETGTGTLQFVANGAANGVDSEFELMERVARSAGRPLTYSSAQGPDMAHALELLRQANERGVVMKAQLLPRPVGLVIGLKTSVHPFSMSPSYAALADLPLTEKVSRMRDPDMRARLIAEAPLPPTNPVFNYARLFDRMYPIGHDDVDYEPAPEEGVDGRARIEGRSPEEVAYDMLLEDDGNALLFVAMANYSDGNLDFVETMLNDPNVIVGLGDGGAHYGMVCDASFTTFALTHWTRDRPKGRFALEAMIRILTRAPAEVMGLKDRGLIAPGHRAHINVIDYERLKLHSPELVWDLPGGGQRLHQRATGYVATIVSGLVIAENGRPTEARPGKLVRGEQSARNASSV
jgi:N-acyl-D-amino-acid deacylase